MNPNNFCSIFGPSFSFTVGVRINPLPPLHFLFPTWTKVIFWFCFILLFWFWSLKLLRLTSQVEHHPSVWLLRKQRKMRENFLFHFCSWEKLVLLCRLYFNFFLSSKIMTRTMLSSKLIAVHCCYFIEILFYFLFLAAQLSFSEIYQTQNFGCVTVVYKPNARGWMWLSIC